MSKKSGISFRRERDHTWPTLSGFIQTVITVSTGFLAFTVTFSEKFISGERNSVPWQIVVCWALLFVAVAAALFGMGKLGSYLRGLISGGFELPINVAYFALFFAVLFFVFYALSIEPSTPDTLDIQMLSQKGKTIIQRATPETPQTGPNTKAAPELLEIRATEKKDVYSLLFSFGRKTYLVEINSKTQELVRLSEVPRREP